METIKDSVFKSCILTTLLSQNKRKVTNHKNWNSEISIEQQWELLNSLFTKKEIKKPEEKLMSSQIQNKLSSYKYQDIEKNKFNIEKFITLSQTLELLIQSEMNCQYCHKKCPLFYEKVRDPKQWSLDRIDNRFGHHYDNVCISCLSCNLKRRVTQYQKFLFTKNVVICKLDEIKDNDSKNYLQVLIKNNNG